MKIEEAKNKIVKMSANSLTVKDENGKTAGVITRATRFNNLPFREQVNFSGAVRASGFWGKTSSLIACNNKLYYLYNLRRLKYADDTETAELESEKEQAAKYFEVIPCHLIITD